MYFKYGSYQHDANEVDMTTITKHRMYSKRNRVVFTRHTLSLTGHICEGSQSDIKEKIEEVEAAYFYDFEDAGLYHDNGTVSAHFLDHSTAINGVRVKQVNFPKGGGGEYATGRIYQIVLEGDYLNANLDQIYSWQESVQMIGTGGPMWEHVPVLLGLPVIRQIHERTPQTIIQSGRSVGVTGWPLQPTPILATNLEHRDRRVVERGSAMKIGVNIKLLFPLTYRYVFTLANPLSALAPRADWN